MRSAAIVLLVGILLLPGAMVARAAQDDAVAPFLESEELAVLLARVKKKLDRPTARGIRELLRLDYYVTVYGTSPQMAMLKGFELHRSPVPSPVGPTAHLEMMRSLRLNTVYPGTLPLGANPVAGWAWRALR